MPVNGHSQAAANRWIVRRVSTLRQHHLPDSSRDGCRTFRWVGCVGARATGRHDRRERIIVCRCALNRGDPAADIPYRTGASPGGRTSCTVRGASADGCGAMWYRPVREHERGIFATVAANRESNGRRRCQSSIFLSNRIISLCSSAVNVRRLARTASSYNGHA